jgi:D-alanine-D-alanine ligase
MKTVTPATFGRVAVLMGGLSAEREVSLKSGGAVLAALKRRGVDAQGVDVGSDILEVLRKGEFDRIFLALHGRGGEDGTLQGALEILGLPYTGSGVLASALGMDKWRTKLVWQGAGLPIPDYVLLNARSDFASVEAHLGFPLFVKPANEGSSVGVSKVKRAGELRVAFEEAVKHDPLVLAERFVGGGEYTVAILNGEAPAGEFYDYEAKYLRDDTLYLCPCGLAPEREKEIQSVALKAFNVLGCRGWGRVDFLMDKNGRVYMLEVNTAPGMTDHSLVPMAARTAGIDFDELVWRILSATLGGVRE